MVFGSVIENKLTHQSDIDIAVKFNNIDLREATLFRARIAGNSNKRVDIQVYNCLLKNIKKEIDEKGRTLYKK